MSKIKEIQTLWIQIKFKGHHRNEPLQNHTPEAIKAKIKEVEEEQKKKSIGYKLTEYPF